MIKYDEKGLPYSVPGGYGIRGVLGLVYIGMKQAGFSPEEIEKAQDSIRRASWTYGTNDSAEFFAPLNVDELGNLIPE